MKSIKFSKEISIFLILFVLFPVVYLVQDFFMPEPTPVLPEPMVPQANLHFSMTEQRMDGDTLIITVCNTGESAWAEKDLIRGALYMDGTDTGIRAIMEPGTIIEVGDTISFQFADVRQYLGESLQVGMVQETVTYFPEIKPVVVE